MLNLAAKVINKIKQKLLNHPSEETNSNDDFNWNLYNQHYRGELTEIQKVNTLRIAEGDYNFIDNLLVLQQNILPLHPNHRLLYETILQLNPNKIIEIGCGGGDHLHNLSILSSRIDLFGLDLSKDQILYLTQRNPDLKARIEQFDITLPFSGLLPSVDIAYTQAVIMHLKTANNYLIALSNLFKLAQNQVILMENWTAHNFMDAICFLFDKKMIPWQNIYFYCQRSPELNNQPHLMIISAYKLDYEELIDYEQLRQPLLTN